MRHRAPLALLAGVLLLVAALALHAILLEIAIATIAVAGAGAVLTVAGAFAMRTDLGTAFGRRRGEIFLYTAGVVGLLVAVAYLSVRVP